MLMSERRLIVGLGNPGREHKHNRHNIGFHVLDALAGRYGSDFSRLQADAFVASARLGDCTVVLAKPQTFMNRSGRPVATLQRFYKIEMADLLVVYDELDLPLGTIRLKPSGGAGGHNGMRDVIRYLGSEDFPRLRVGIGRPPGRMEPAAYVLQNFGPDQQPVVGEAIERTIAAIQTWLTEGIELAMSRHNQPAAVE
jgi:PTH1 family peptidyl-tRNA hydrolase